MRSIGIFLALLALWLIGASAWAQGQGKFAAGSEPSLTGGAPPRASWHAPAWRQVHIEQHFWIRITPGTASMPPSLVEELEEDERVERLPVRKIGKCLAINNIAAVQAGDANELLLFLRDQRVISAKLEKRCSARDFYSGFYLERNADGAICTGRDFLQSRSGANCKLKRLKELVPTGFRRFP